MKKKIIILLFLVGCSSLYANNFKEVSKALVSLSRQQFKGNHLAALDTATYILTIDADNAIAKNYVRNHWDETTKAMREAIDSLSDDNSLAHAKKRLEIFYHLDNIQNNIRCVPMPLYGPNQRWVWQPEISYYSGLYASERVRVFNLVLSLAEQALRDYNTEQAQEYYAYALEELLLDTERSSNRVLLRDHVNKRLQELEQSNKLYELIMACSLADLSLWLDKEQPEIAEQRTMLQKQIEAMYLAEAEQQEAQADSVSQGE